MPSYDQIVELCDSCTWQLTQRNGVNGRLVTGPNGNTLFLPAAGFRWYDTLNYAGSYGYYWSRTLSSGSSNGAYYLDVDSGYVYWFNYVHRLNGCTVRAVRVS